eukprot:scaffold2928_cov79-Cylindrotheca_fusiformis.AAC.3
MKIFGRCLSDNHGRWRVDHGFHCIPRSASFAYYGAFFRRRLRKYDKETSHIGFRQSPQKDETPTSRRQPP